MSPALREAEFEAEARGFDAEHEAQRQGKVPIQWIGRNLTLEQAVQVPGGGLYVITQKGRPIYVGKADSFAERLKTRAQYLRQANVPLSNYRVSVGRVGGGTAARLAAEHSLVRYLTQHARKRFPLTNQSSTGQFRVPAGKNLAVTHRGQAPSFFRSPIKVRGGGVYESEAAAFELEGEMFFGAGGAMLNTVAAGFWAIWRNQLEAARRMFTQARWGCWCGPGNVCTTIQDPMDACCRAHDQEYTRVGVTSGTGPGIGMWTLDGLKRTRIADETLVVCTQKTLWDGRFYGPAGATFRYGVAYVFGTRAAGARAAQAMGL
jgi:hypothetical protein